MLDYNDADNTQVITKIVDYELHPGQSYEGVWHVEGMSHENIVATVLYILDRDTELEGGDVLFKRLLSMTWTRTVISFTTEREAGYDEGIHVTRAYDLFSQQPCA